MPFNDAAYFDTIKRYLSGFNSFSSTYINVTKQVIIFVKEAICLFSSALFSYKILCSSVLSYTRAALYPFYCWGFVDLRMDRKEVLTGLFDCVGSIVSWIDLRKILGEFLGLTGFLKLEKV